jgi:ABC-2 type transport system ATP-binding protein
MGARKDAEGTPMLAASHLAYRYGRRRWGLLDGHFSVGGPVVGVLGPAGAGKSTLLSLLTAARIATSGTLLVSGLDPAQRRQRRQLRSRLGFVPQSLSIYPRQTVGEFLAYVGWLRQVPAARLAEAIADSLLATDLTELRDRRVRSLPTGTRQRLVLAQVLVNRPSLVVLDEPLVGLDLEQRAQFLARVAAMADRDRIVVLATPLAADVAAICTDVVVLCAGRTLFSGTTGALAGAGDPARDPDPDAVLTGYHRLLAEVGAVAG